MNRVIEAAGIDGRRIPHEPASFATTLARFAPAVPRMLVSRDAFDRLLAVADLLPATLTDCAYFECRLRGDDPQVDLVLAVEERGRSALMSARAAATLLGRDGWGPVWVLCEHWTNPASPLRGIVHHIWLEFDVTGDRPGAPSIFVCFSELPPPGYSACTITCDAVRLRLGRPLTPGLARTFGPRSSGCRIRHVPCRPDCSGRETLLWPRTSRTCRTRPSRLSPPSAGPGATTSSASAREVHDAKRACPPAPMRAWSTRLQRGRASAHRPRCYSTPRRSGALPGTPSADHPVIVICARAMRDALSPGRVSIERLPDWQG